MEPLILFKPPPSEVASTHSMLEEFAQALYQLLARFFRGEHIVVTPHIEEVILANDLVSEIASSRIVSDGDNRLITILLNNNYSLTIREEQNNQAKKMVAQVKGLAATYDIEGLASLEDLQLYAQLYEKKLPQTSLCHLVALKNCLAEKNQAFSTTLDALKGSLATNPSIAYANLSVTTNAAGDLVCALHVADKKEGHVFVDVVCFKKKFYNDISRDAQVALARDPDVVFAKKVASVLRGDSAPLLDDTWQIKTFFDLVCEYDAKELNTQEPDAHLDCLGSGFTTKKLPILSPTASVASQGEVPLSSSRSPRTGFVVQHTTRDAFPEQFHGMSDPSYETSLLTYKTAEQMRWLKMHGRATHVVNGPSSVTGAGFDKNVIEGFFAVVNQINTSKQAIHISGHSRGAVEAIAINNLLVYLKRSNGEMTEFVDTYLRDIKKNVEECIGLNDKQKMLNILQEAKAQLNNGNIQLSLSLAEPVQGPDVGPFHHQAFALAKEIQVDSMHRRVDILMGSQESHTVGFDLHIPKVNQIGDTTCQFNLYNILSKHGNVVKEPHLKKTSHGYTGSPSGSFEGPWALGVLSGRAHERPLSQHLSFLPVVKRHIVPGYVCRNEVYQASAWVKPSDAIEDASPPWYTENYYQDSPMIFP